jgi:hypothetical protein
MKKYHLRCWFYVPILDKSYDVTLRVFDTEGQAREFKVVLDLAEDAIRKSIAGTGTVGVIRRHYVEEV